MILTKDFMDSGSFFHSAPMGRNNRRISENDSFYSFPGYFYYVELMKNNKNNHFLLITLCLTSCSQ